MRSGDAGSEKIVNFESAQDFIALAPGNHELTVKMIYNNNEYSESATISVGFPSFSEASADAGVQQRINELWSLTLNNATPESCREYGMAVYADTRGGALAYVAGETVVGEAWAYTDDNQPSVNITIQDMPSSDIFRGGRWGVGTVHTHPPLWNSPREGWRYTGLSDTDQTQATNVNMPYMVIDVPGQIYDDRRDAFIHQSTDTPTTVRRTFITDSDVRAI